MYEGYQIWCGCHCKNCGSQVRLEGYSDAEGTHYCPHCDDYVRSVEHFCKARRPEEIRHRQEIIAVAGADKE